MCCRPVSRGMSSGRRFPSGLRLCIAVMVSACLAITAVTGCAQKKELPSARPPEVTVLTVTPRDTPVSFEYVAQTQSSQQVNINARVNGFLDKRVYTEGAIVKAGQVLFLMDKKPFQAQVDGAAAALARQKAALETARLNLERTKPLTAQNALSQKDLDDASGSFESTAAAVEQAKSQLETAQLNLSYCTISSPVNGITGAAQQQDGTYINAQNSLLTTVAVLSPIWVNFSISENEMKSYRDQVAAGKIRPPRDQNYTIEIVHFDGSIFPHAGRITYADPSYNAKTGTFMIRASVLNPTGILRPNQYVRARIKGAVRPNAILVPQQAVQQGAKGHFVWVITREGKATYRPVVVGDWHGDDWFITEGLREGDQVVVNGGLTLRPDVTVTAQPFVAAAGPTPVAGSPRTGTARSTK
jgi:membrane fusion protein, multidrug efflux system